MGQNLLTINEPIHKEYFGEIELEFRDSKTKKIVEVRREPNIIKIFAKEIMSHSILYDKLWDQNANGGQGEWVDNNLYDDFKLKYILLGASYDVNGVPLDANDSRYYEIDKISGLYKPIKLMPGADYDGGLINAIPIDEANHRPLKRIEKAYFKPTYQPAGSPLLQPDVRAINNILVVETVLTEDEYNGFGLIESDHFTITEVALTAGTKIDHVSGCDVDPRELFLQGPYSASASGGDTISLSHIEEVNKISVGDQIKIVTPSTGDNQVSPYYLVIGKSSTGVDITLDRTPMDGTSAIVGDISIYKDTLRIFSHRILNTPAKKSANFEITIRWSIYFT